MKHTYFWHIAVAKYITSVFVVFSLYLSAFIYLMRMEGQFEHANIINGIYWLVCTVTTVGYGDITLSSDAGKLFLCLFNSRVFRLFLVFFLHGCLFPGWKKQ
jgi:voltage-gated potassium channel